MAALVLAACTEPGVAPNDPLARAPTVQMTQLGGDPASGDLCGGLSPCDAYDYRGDGSTGVTGICFLPPTVDNHLSNPACAAPNIPGLDGLFQLAWCQVEYADPSGATPPAIVPGTCQDPADWVDLVESDGMYTASVQWRRSQADDGDVFRVYVVRGAQAFAHRDLVIDPNLTTPSDGFVHSIGYGNEPIKLVITEDFSCIRYDTQEGSPENAATCLISGETAIGFDTEQTDVTFFFPPQGFAFFADFEVSECLSLGFEVNPATGLPQGNALVDTPLGDCKFSVSSEEIDLLTVPGQIQVSFADTRWSTGGPFELARVNVLQYDELGLGALPPSSDPGWFGEATSDVAALRWLDWGLDKLADLILPQPLSAAIGTWDFSRMSDFQVFVAPVYDFASEGIACSSGEPHCLDLGAFDDGEMVPVSVHVSAPPSDDASPEYPVDYLDVPDTRLHFFPESGTVSCLPGSAPVAPGYRGCVEAGNPDLSTDPPSYWDHLVVVTDELGLGDAHWLLDEGSNTLRVSACAVARPGINEAQPPGEPGADDVWGTLGDCSDRQAALTDPLAYDNGPADGPYTPFEPVDVVNEVAPGGLPLTFIAATCPTINVDGMKADAFGGTEWEACAVKTTFTAPVKGPKVEDNAALYTYSDGEALYIGLEIETTDIGNRAFVNLVESFGSGDGVDAAGDELLVLDFGGEATSVDWHYTQSCVDNNASSLCGDPDASGDGAYGAAAAALEGGAGGGTVFYEFVRPFGSPNAVAGSGKEDLAVGPGDALGLRVTVTQGQGGGKAGLVYPDPQTTATDYHVFTIE